MNFIKSILKKIIPNVFLRYYHFFLAWLGSVIYANPSSKIFVVGITGTKGKTTTAELVSEFLTKAGYKTAILSTLHFKIGDQDKRNLRKMTMPGRFFVQEFLHKSIKANCDYVILEMTSEGVKQFRHKFIELDSLIWTNISPEHIESHGSFEAYIDAKLEIVKQLEKSNKQDKTLIVNKDDDKVERFLDFSIKNKLKYSLDNFDNFTHDPDGISFHSEGRQVKSSLVGKFNLYNILAAYTFAKTQGVAIDQVSDALLDVSKVRGRVEKIFLSDGEAKKTQDFEIIVDYAHTPDSLEKLYQAFDGRKKICVLGNTGGGRDKWKRPAMGQIADQHCSSIYLTNEDPYDEDPVQILEQMADSMNKNKPNMVLNRREAINQAIASAEKDDVVIISGKGTDPYIMGPSGEKLPWDDAEVAREELFKVLDR